MAGNDKTAGARSQRRDAALREDGGGNLCGRVPAATLQQVADLLEAKVADNKTALLVKLVADAHAKRFGKAK